MFLVPQVSMNFGISPSSKLDTDLVLHLKMCVFSPYYQFLLSLSNILSVFHDSIWIVYPVWHTLSSMLT